jgi:hypothetical protein
MRSGDRGTELFVVRNTGPTVPTMPTDNGLHQTLMGASQCADPRGNIIHALLVDNLHNLFVQRAFRESALHCVSITLTPPCICTLHLDSRITGRVDSVRCSANVIALSKG